MCKRTGKKLGKAEICKIFTQVVSALQFMHNRPKPIGHRDLKPDNIMYDETTKKAFLVDFGLSKEKIQNSKRTTVGGFHEDYSAPEQRNLGKMIDSGSEEDEPEGDHLCDLWSLGATLFKLHFGFDSPIKFNSRDYRNNRVQFPHPGQEPIKA